MRKNLSLVLLLLMLLLSQPAVAFSSTLAARQLKVFDAVWTGVNKKYFDVRFNGVDWARQRETFRPQAQAAPNEAALYRVLNQMLGELRDGHTYAKSPSEVFRAQRRLSLSLGLSGRIMENRVIYTRVVAGSAGHAAGIQPGWILTHVDGVAINPVGFTGFDVGYGETRRATLVDAQDHVREVTVHGRPFTEVPEQQAQILQHGTLYLRFESFSIPQIGKWFQETVARHREAPALIVDLRGNWGGFAVELQECLKPLYARPLDFGAFIERGGQTHRLRVAGRGRQAFEGKVFVLIDEESYSAAELFAAAIQESGRGQVVGRQSTGRALNSREEKLPDGGRLWLSIRDYRTSRGVRLEGRGVVPDVAVSLKLDDVRRRLDRDVERALELVH